MIALVKPDHLDGKNILFRAYFSCDKCGKNHFDKPKAILTTRGTSGQLRSMEKLASKHGWFTNTSHICPNCRKKDSK